MIKDTNCSKGILIEHLTQGYCYRLHRIRNYKSLKCHKSFRTLFSLVIRPCIWYIGAAILLDYFLRRAIAIYVYRGSSGEGWRLTNLVMAYFYYPHLFYVLFLLHFSSCNQSNVDKINTMLRGLIIKFNCN